MGGSIKEEESSVGMTTSVSPVATTTTTTAAAAAVLNERQNSCDINEKNKTVVSNKFEKDCGTDELTQSEQLASAVNKLTKATLPSDDTTTEMKQTDTAKVNGDDGSEKVKLKANLVSSVEKASNQVSTVEKVLKSIEKDERRVAPLIIRTPKLSSIEKESGVEKTRLPAKLTNKNHPTSPASKCNGDVDVEKPRLKPSNKTKSTSSSSPSKSDDGHSKHLSTKRRKREFYRIFDNVWSNLLFVCLRYGTTYSLNCRVIYTLVCVYSLSH